MKFLSTLTLLAATAALVVPEKAEAGDSEKALIGGLIGGIVIGKVLADNDIDTHVSVGYHYGHRDPGYWNWVTVRTWVPGYYERRCDRWGRPQKIWISGHYTHVRKKVWVDGRGGHGHGHHYRHNDRHDRRDHWRDDRRDDRRDGGRRDRDDGRGDRSRQQHAGRF